ncbi:hypothetical protein VTJ83DRAFT_6348 [Remersonia thermophila]|uniref:Uncharacterized protein n=1 Tax=Remersonia thermophila TaxID=72144 RepID=A0ABR4D4G6_9PEZI
MTTANPNPDEIDLVDDDQAGDFEVAVDPDMAATMGFTSFGGTKPTFGNDNSPAAGGDDDDDKSRPSKKRRFNPHADDAIIAPPVPQDTVAAQRAQSNPGNPGPQGKGQQTPRDEISHAPDSDFELDVSAAEAGSGYEPEPGAERKQPPDSGRSTPASRAAGDGHMPARGSTLPARGGRGHNPLWYVDYYDPSFNENPWEGMEKFKGLEPVGTYLVRQWDREDKKVPAA